MEDNENLHNEVEQIRAEYKQKESDIEWKYKSKIKGLEKFINNKKIGEEILPLYLKKPQAQIQLEEKLKAKI